MLESNFKLIYCLIISAMFLPVFNIFGAILKNNVVKNSRIINGYDASLNESRHQVSIRLRSKEGDSYLGYGHSCGGSLISKNVVLSAAHCFLDSYTETPISEKNFIAVMGTVDRLNNKNSLIFDITTVKVHEKFKFETLAHDIALVILNATVPAKHPTVKQITLNEGPIESGTLCQVTGWGFTDYFPSLPRKLQIATQPYIDIDICRELSAIGCFIKEGMLCAGYLWIQTNVNSGDSGGPLACLGIQAGIVSFRSFDYYGPGVYTDIAYYKDWILNELTKLQANLPKFSLVSNKSLVERY